MRDRIEGLGELLLAAFTVAARRRFSPTWNPAEIVRFVAGVRSRTDEMAALLEPSAVENQLRLALGKSIAPYPDMEARGRVPDCLTIAAQCPAVLFGDPYLVLMLA